MIDPQRTARKLVLVADDDADILELLTFRLERAGYEVITAGAIGNRLVIVKSAVAAGRSLHLSTVRGRLS